MPVQTGSVRVYQRTFELDISMYKADRVHPPENVGQLAKDASSESLGDLPVMIRQKIEEFPSGGVLENKAGVKGRLKRGSQVH